MKNPPHVLMKQKPKKKKLHLSHLLEFIWRFSCCCHAISHPETPSLQLIWFGMTWITSDWFDYVLYICVLYAKGITWAPRITRIAVVEKKNPCPKHHFLESMSISRSSKTQTYQNGPIGARHNRTQKGTGNTLAESHSTGEKSFERRKFDPKSTNTKPYTTWATKRKCLIFHCTSCWIGILIIWFILIPT